MKRKYNTIIILGTLTAIFLLLLLSPKESLENESDTDLDTNIEATKNPDDDSTDDLSKDDQRNLNQAQADQPFDPEAFKTKYPGPWSMTYNEQGEIQSLSGGTIPLKNLSTQSVINTAREMAPYFGVPADQLSDKVVEPSETPHGKNFKVAQTYQGLPVYDSSLFYYASKKDTSLRIIDNSLKIIDEASLEKKYDPDDALDIVLRSFAGFKKLETAPIESFIYVINQKGEWVYRIIITNTQDDREILISALTGDILLNQSLVIE